VGSSGDGTSWAQAKKTWAEMDTLLDALGTDGAGDTVDVNSGSYGDMIEGVLSEERDDWLTFEAATDTVPDINYIETNGNTGTQLYLKFIGFDVNDRINCRNGIDYLWVEDCEISANPLTNLSGGFYAPYWKGNADYIIRLAGGSSNITIKDCNLVGGYQGVSASWPMDNVTIVGNTIHNLAADGLSIAGCNDLIIRDNTIYDIDCRRTFVAIIGTQAGGDWTAGEVLNQAVSGAAGVFDSNSATRLYAYITSETEWAGTNTESGGYSSPGDNGTITGATSGNTVTSITTIDPFHSECMEILHYKAQTQTNVLVERNNCYRLSATTWIQNNQGGKFHAYATSTWVDVVVQNNIFLATNRSLLLTGANGISFYNNTMPLGDLDVDLESSSNSTQIDEFYNNIITTISVNIDQYGKTCQIVSHGNNIYSEADPNHLGGSYTYPFEIGATDLAGQDLTASYFTDYATNDFTLLVGSSAINAGNGTYAPAVDILSISRPQGGVDDIGAYEYVSPTKYLIGSK